MSFEKAQSNIPKVTPLFLRDWNSDWRCL